MYKKILKLHWQWTSNWHACFATGRIWVRPQIACGVTWGSDSPFSDTHIGLLRRYPIQKTLHIFYKKKQMPMNELSILPYRFL